MAGSGDVIDGNERDECFLMNLGKLSEEEVILREFRNCSFLMWIALIIGIQSYRYPELTDEDTKVIKRVWGEGFLKYFLPMSIGLSAGTYPLYKKGCFIFGLLFSTPISGILTYFNIGDELARLNTPLGKMSRESPNRKRYRLTCSEPTTTN